MIRYLPLLSLLLILSLSHSPSAQTVLYPGEMSVIGVATFMGPCGLSAESDEISFVCYRDITTGTVIDITDNGWETSNPGLWGNKEGIVRITRVGPTVPKGTVFTLQATNLGSSWDYQMWPFQGWQTTHISPSGGNFNLEMGGDQVYFLSGGTWDFGAGTDEASYDGKVLTGYNTRSVWAADGTNNQSNLHPSLEPCYHMEAPDSEYYKYTGNFEPAYINKWLTRIQDPASWTDYADCISYVAGTPNYQAGYNLSIEMVPIGLYCVFCDMCPPYLSAAIWSLPEGEFDVVYTNGIDTFEVSGVQHLDYFQFEVTETIMYWVISITEVGGCPLPENFDLSATYVAPYNDPGEYAVAYTCEDYVWGTSLIHFLNGTPEPGGIWSPAIAFNQQYYSDFGEGQFLYIFPHGHTCPPDTASVNVIFSNTEGTSIEVGCDQNGTPNNIFDDATTITLTVFGNNMGPTYDVSISSGNITPSSGTTGVPTVFTLSPGSAIGPNLTLSVHMVNPPNMSMAWCVFDFPIESPGYCSNPCDDAMISTVIGDEEICLNSCPDDPATIEIEVEGGTSPYLMDFSVTAPTFPTWNFTNVQILDFNQIEICVDNIPAPVFNPATFQLTIPAAFGGEQMVFTMTAVRDFYNCTGAYDNTYAYVTVYDLPELDTIALVFCSEFAETVDLTEYDIDINPFLDITWYDGNPFTGGDDIFNPNVTNLNNVGELWAYAADDNCENAIQVAFTIFPSPDIDSIPPIEICKGTPVVLQTIPITDDGNSMATYSYHINFPLDSSTLLDPLYFLPLDSTTVYLHATAGICYDTLSIDINVQDYPDFTLQGTPCDLLLDTYSVIFTSSADSIHASAGTVTNNPNGQDLISGIPNNTNVTIEILNISGLCKDTFLITAPNCDCPFIPQPVAAQPDYSICEGSPVPVLSVTVNAGLNANWYTVPSGGVAVQTNSLTYQPPSAVNATYYVEAIDPSNSCYSIRTQIDFDVFPIAILQQIADPSLCETETINFSNLVPGVINGVTGSGSWFNLVTNLPVSGTVIPQDGNSWYYVFTSNPGNCVSRDTISANVNPVPSIDFYEILCDENTLTYDLFFTSDADDVMASQGTVGHIAGTDSFSLVSIPFNTDIQFNIENTLTGCTALINQSAPDCSCPGLLQATEHDACSDDGNIDLTAFEGIGVTGAWQLVSTPPGGNPATLIGSNFQGQDADAGLYTLRFIRSVILADCIDTASFEITIHASPAADAGFDATVCAPDNILLSGSGVGNIQWQTSGSGVITNPNVFTTSYTPTLADITAGGVSFTLTATDPTGFCPSAQETIDITIDGTAYFILDPGTQTYCDTSDIQVDLDDFITFGTTSGVWFFPDTVNAPITGSAFNPTTLTAGTYTVFYTSTNAIAPCENDTAGLNIIIENCLCPSVALSVPSNSLCSETGIQDLDNFLITTEPGTWSIVSAPAGSNPATLSGSDFSTNDSDAGIYRLRYTLANPVTGCDEFGEINFEVIQTPAIQVTMVECADDLQSWQAVIITSGTNVTASPGSVTSLGSDRYLVENITLNTNLVVTVSDADGICINDVNVSSPDCECTLAISNLPDEAVLCPGETLILEPVVTGGKGVVTEFWVVNNDSLYQHSLEIGQQGTYSFVSFDDLGCRQEHALDVSIYEEMIPDISAGDITCPGDRNGVILLHGIDGGNGPYFISLNNGTLQPIVSFPYQINDLGAGNYTINLVDGFGCAISFNIMIQSASSETVFLGDDQTILVGDSVTISPVVSFVPDSFYWTGDIDLITADQLIQNIFPEEEVVVTLYAIDDKGCIYSDDLRIRVLLSSSIFVPTVFSPNGDGVNDLIAPLTDPSIVSFESFEIFSRWGELVYSKHDFLPNQNGFGWDGNLKDKPMGPGVFVYRLSATNKRGKVYQQYGDITLIR